MRDTQLEAWQDIQPKLGTKQQEVLNEIRLQPRTGYEIAAALGWYSYRTLPRVTELAKLGLIVDSGRRRINPDSGKKTIVWMVAYNGD